MLEFTNSFEPHSLCRSGFAQTILGSRFPGRTVLPPRKQHKLKIGPRVSLLVFELPSINTESPVVLMAHGMGGCSESGYMRRIAGKLVERGFSVFMMNHRGSGPGMGLSDTLWNGGSSEDIEKVVQYIIQLHPCRPILLVGFSLSGNVLLKYLGEGRDIPSNVAGAFAVNPPVDLRVASEILSRNSAVTGIFNGYYMKMIHRQREALAECFPDALHPPENMKTIWEFDVAYTAPAAGYKDVEEYYKTCSANQYLRMIRTPTILLCAKDDPFVPPEVFDRLRMSLSVYFYAPDAGGHLGYLCQEPTPLGDRRWMDFQIVDWVHQFAGKGIQFPEAFFGKDPLSF
ncbi:MAG: alpha/beta fold hydrolase [Nitrospinaceae bacterium]